MGLLRQILSPARFVALAFPLYGVFSSVQGCGGLVVNDSATDPLYGRDSGHYGGCVDDGDHALYGYGCEPDDVYGYRGCNDRCR